MAGVKPLDAAFLRLEDDRASLCIASIAVFEGPMPPRKALMVHLAARTRDLPRFRQVLREAPLHLGGPRWVDDPDFHIAHHLFWAGLPRPNTDTELDEFVARLMSVPADRDRPMWETWFVDGLAGDRWAMISKVHHSMVDGVGGAELLAAMLTVERSGAARRAPHKRAPGRAGGSSSARHPSLSAARGILHFAGLATPVPESFLVGRLGRARDYATADIPFADLTAVRSHFGGTVNDVVLCAAARAFRDLVVSRGEHPSDIRVRSLVPISVREQRRDGIGDNHVTAVVADLPIGAADPVARLTAVHEEMQRMKGSGEPEAGVLVTTVLARLPQGAVNAAMSAVFAVRQWFLTTVTTNIPGSRTPMSLLDCPLVALYPYVPIADRIRVGIAVASYRDTLYVGVTTDRDHVTAAPLAASMAAEVAELVTLARS